MTDAISTKTAENETGDAPLEVAKPSDFSTGSPVAAGLDAPPGGTAPLVDGLALWGSEKSTVASGPVSLIRLDRSETLILLFTVAMVRVQLHFLDLQSVRQYVRCNGNGCVLCAVGRPPETRDLLPVLNLVDRSVGVIAISPNIRPHALRPQLAPLLTRLKEGAALSVVAISNEGAGRFNVKTLPLPPDADDGRDVVQQFKQDMDRGIIDLSAVYSIQSNTELLAIPEIATMAKLKGLNS